MRKTLIQAVLFACIGGVVPGTTVTAQISPPPRAPAEWTLDAVITAALTQQPLIDAAKARLTAAEGGRQTASVLPNPVATYWVENARFPGGASSTALDRESSVYATLPLEPFLQRRSRIAQAGHEIRAAQASVTTAEQAVAREAIHAFYRVALAQASLDAVRDNLTAIDQLVVYLRNRVAQGAAPEGELIRAEVERDRVDTDATLADVELLRAQAALRPFLGGADATGRLRVVAPDWARERVALGPVTEFTAYALAHRAELAASRATADARASALNLERSLVVRQLGASFGFKQTAGVNTTMVVGISLTVPLFDRNRGEIQRATSEHLAATMESQWLERTITSEVEAEYQAAERLAARITVLQPSFLSRAAESRRIALGAYQEGATGLLQVLDASRALSDARLTYARIVAAANESLFDLGIAAGYDARSAARLGRGAPGPVATRPDGGSR